MNTNKKRLVPKCRPSKVPQQQKRLKLNIKAENPKLKSVGEFYKRKEKKLLIIDSIYAV